MSQFVYTMFGMIKLTAVLFVMIRFYLAECNMYVNQQPMLHKKVTVLYEINTITARIENLVLQISAGKPYNKTNCCCP